MIKRAIILAAGRGTRMASYSNTCPKALLEFRGEALISRQLRSFEAAGITDIVLVGGYLFNNLSNYIEERGFKCQIIYNPFYAVTNSIASLWFARNYLDEDVFITNADTYYETEILNSLMKNNNDYVFGVDESKRIDADYRVTIFDDEIMDMGKDIPQDDVNAEYIGIALIRKNGIMLFRDLLEKTIETGNYNLWWEDLFIELMSKSKKISFSDVTGRLWFEVDEPKDYRKHQRHF